MNETFNYNEKLIHAGTLMQVVVYDLYAYGMNIGCLTAFKDLFDVFAPGEEIPVDFSLLETLDDPAVEQLVKIIDLLCKAQGTLVNINALTFERLNDAYSEAKGSEHWCHMELPRGPGDYHEWLHCITVYLHVTTLEFFRIALQLERGTLVLEPDVYGWYCFPDDETLDQLEGNDQNVKLIKSLLSQIWVHYMGINKILG